MKKINLSRALSFVAVSIVWWFVGGFVAFTLGFASSEGMGQRSTSGQFSGWLLTLPITTDQFFADLVKVLPLPSGVLWLFAFLLMLTFISGVLFLLDELTKRLKLKIVKPHFALYLIVMFVLDMDLFSLAAILASETFIWGAKKLLVKVRKV